MAGSPIKEEIFNRLSRLQERLKVAGIEGVLLVQKVDVYYFSGTDQNAHLWIQADTSPLLMVRKNLARAKEDSVLEDVIFLEGLSRLPLLIERHTGSIPSKIGIEMDVLPAGQYLIYNKLFPDAEFVDISPLIRSIRMIKSSLELSYISQAAQVADQMMGQVPLLLKEVETETDLAMRLEVFYRSKGHAGFIRTRGFNMECCYGHVMAGKNATAPSSSPGPTGGRGLGPFYSQGASTGKISPKDPILVDYSSNIYGYISDQTRIFSVGRPAVKLLDAHQVMLEVQEAISQRGRPGTRACDLYDLACGIVEKVGFLEGFMGYPDPVPFVGHGVGLELDELPVIGYKNDAILEQGMVVAIEPKYVLPGKGVVGIENTFVITSRGMKRLNFFPDSICIV